MPVIKIKTKEFKSLLKTFQAISYQGFRRTATLTINLDPKLQFLSSVDNTFIIANPAVEVVDATGPKTIHVDSTVLNSLVLNGKEVVIGWTDGSKLQLSDGNLKLDLHIGVPTVDWTVVPEKLESHIEMPLGLLNTLCQYVDLPYSYFKAKKDIAPIRFFNRNGFLAVAADDSYSLAEVGTNYPVPKDFDIRIPYYVIQALFRKLKDDDSKAFLGHHGYSVYLNNGAIEVYTAGLNDTMKDFDETFSEVSNWVTSCKFNPAQLAATLKPIVSVIPSQDASGAIIMSDFKPSGLSLEMRHASLGEARVDNVDGIQELCNEKGLPRVHINMHPGAFSDFSSLFDLPEGKMICSANAVYYEGNFETAGSQCRLRYLFATVSV